MKQVLGYFKHECGILVRYSSILYACILLASIRDLISDGSALTSPIFHLTVIVVSLVMVTLFRFSFWMAFVWSESKVQNTKFWNMVLYDEFDRNLYSEFAATTRLHFFKRKN